MTKKVSSETKLYLADGIGFVEILGCFGDDLTIVNAARVSFNKESVFEKIVFSHAGEEIIEEKLSARDVQLIDYLAQHRHVAPFFHPQLRFRFKMPIFIAREWYRHTVGFCRNEVSRRYVTSDPECFLPQGVRQCDVSVKQGSSANYVAQSDEILVAMSEYMEKAVVYYKQLLACGVCPEQARIILPQAMYTEFIETASLAGYARLVGLRVAPNAQREIGMYAALVARLVEERFPVGWRSLMTYKTA